MKRKLLYCLLCCSTLLFGCAAGYKTLNPESLVYVRDNASSPNVSAEYHFNGLVGAKNKKYHKKEIKRGTQLVAIKISNNTSEDLEYNKNFLLYSGQTQVSVLPVETVHNDLKQQAPLYLLHLLWTFTNLTTNTSSSSNGTVTSSETKVFPIGLIIGPVVAFGNVLVASSANNKFRSELTKHSIFNKVIKKGETAFFLVGLKSSGFAPISVKTTNVTSGI